MNSLAKNIIQFPLENESFIDMRNYKLPDGKRSVDINHIYGKLPRNSGQVDFDIYDYQMLFKDEETRRVMREGKTIGCFYI